MAVEMRSSIWQRQTCSGSMVNSSVLIRDISSDKFVAEILWNPKSLLHPLAQILFAHYLRHSILLCLKSDHNCNLNSYISHTLNWRQQLCISINIIQRKVAKSFSCCYHHPVSHLFCV